MENNTQLPESLINISTKLEKEFSGKIPHSVEYLPDETKMRMTLDFADSSWYQLYAKAGLKLTSRYIFRLDRSTQTAYFTEERLRIDWEAGIPTFSVKADYFRGQRWGASSGVGYGIKDDGTAGELYSYSDDVSKNFQVMVGIFESEGWKLKRDYSGFLIRFAIIMAIGGGVAFLVLFLLMAMFVF